MINNKLLSIDFSSLQNFSMPNIRSGTTIGQVVTQVLILVFPLAGLIVFLFLIYGGYKYMTSQGDPKSIQSAQQTLTYAVIGFLVMFSAYFVVKFFGLALNLSLPF